MSSEARTLLNELKNAKDPNLYITDKYQSCTKQEKNSLNKTLGELERLGYLSVLWADNIAYFIAFKNGINDNVNNMNCAENVLIIGDNNKINNSNIGVNNSLVGEQEKKRFWEKHPLALALIATIIATFIMMFSFWDILVAFIEGLFS